MISRKLSELEPVGEISELRTTRGFNNLRKLQAKWFWRAAKTANYTSYRKNQVEYNAQQSTNIFKQQNNKLKTPQFRCCFYVYVKGRCSSTRVHQGETAHIWELFVNLLLWSCFWRLGLIFSGNQLQIWNSKHETNIMTVSRDYLNEHPDLMD